MKREQKPFSKKIHFSSDEIWTYKVYSVDTTVIKDPELNKYIVRSMVLSGYTDTTSYEKDCWKSGVPITPSQVKTYIENHLRNKKD